MSLRIITTGDGSHSLFHDELNETYHSRHGAIRESRHVFIENGLSHWLTRSGSRHARVVEVGFGTGLNAWLTLHAISAHSATVVYTSIEAYPLSREVWTQLNYAPVTDITFSRLHEAAWNSPVPISDTFTLEKLKGKLEEQQLSRQTFDVIYFDAFAPSRQPEMWELSMLKKVCSQLAEGGIFVTYCARGQLKRDLRLLGLDVETLTGPPGKKEMVRATRRSLR